MRRAWPYASPWAWKGNVSIQLYQEFPAAKAYYDRIDGDRGDGHLLHFAYTQYNQDMKYFVEQRGMSPDDARAEIRRINDAPVSGTSTPSARERERC